jgi:hypothetical protein
MSPLQLSAMKANALSPTTPYKPVYSAQPSVAEKAME